MVRSPQFQRWAARMPFVRGIARGRAGDLFDVCAGFVYSQVLFACVELRLLDRLAAGPATPSDLAQACRLAPDPMRRLLHAAEALGLVQGVGADRFALAIGGAALLGNPGVGAMVAHHAMLYRDLADPVALLRGETAATELSRFWPYAESVRPDDLGSDAVSPYSALMSDSLAMLADDVLDAYPLRRHAALLDVGGGSGAFATAAAQRNPGLSVTTFDLPAVAELARERFDGAGIAARARAIGGDFKRDALPRGADIVSLVRVAHDLDDSDLDALLRAIHAALPPAGSLLLAEPMAGTPGAERVGAYFAFYLLAMQRGRPRTVADLARRLERAGFARVRRVRTGRPMLTSLLVARTS